MLQVMRQPLEGKLVVLSRTTGTLTFAANFMLVATSPRYGATQTAMNSCLCGYYGDPVKECTCSPRMITRYHLRTHPRAPGTSCKV